MGGVSEFAVVDVRWQCPRGHFVADASIQCEDYRDDFAYYGIRTECQYTCRGCGETYQELPRCVEVGRSHGGGRPGERMEPVRLGGVVHQHGRAVLEEASR